jgi:hypothetical protein
MKSKKTEDYVVYAERTVLVQTIIKATSKEEAEKVANSYPEHATCWETIGSGWEVTNVVKKL